MNLRRFAATAGLALVSFLAGRAVPRPAGVDGNRRPVTPPDRTGPWGDELVRSLAQPALLFAADGRLQAANGPARRLLRIPADTADVAVERAVADAGLAEAVAEARGTGAPVTRDVQHADHELRATVSLVGEQALLLIADRTRERRVEELRRNFVANASHELKTPVTGIQTLAEALKVTVQTDPTRVPALVGRLNVEAERLARLVGDLLDLRRLEERSSTERVPVDLAEVVRQVAADEVDLAESRELDLVVDVPEQAVIAGLPGDLELIVKNLLGNAIQYNRPGGRVELRLQPRAHEQVLVVRDTGIGIPRQDLARIFERFYRVDSARSRETGGTGLGLSIVRHAAERHGGRVRVDSTLGEGTTFTVTLPNDPGPLADAGTVG